MPKTFTADEYHQKPREELAELHQEWQNRVDQPPIPIGRGTWIATKAAVVGALSAVPAAIAGFSIKMSKIRKDADLEFGKVSKEFTRNLNDKLSAEEGSQLMQEADERIRQNLSEFRSIKDNMVKNFGKVKDVTKYAAIGGAFAMTAISAFVMVKRRRKIISDKADNQVMKISQAEQDIALKEADEKNSHLSAKLEEMQRSAEAHHGKKDAEKEHGEKEYGEHARKVAEIEHETKHERKSHEDDTRITKEENELLNTRLAAGKHGEEKHHSKEHEKKDHLAHADREEKSEHHRR